SKISHYKANIFAWSLYDLANTIYSMGVVSLTILPFIAILAISNEVGVSPDEIINSTIDVSKDDFKAGFNRANLLYGVVIFTGSVLMAVISPLLGAYADQINKRKYLLSFVTLFCLAFIFLISYRLTLFWVLGIFLLANLSYQIGLVIYDSMLPFVARPDHVSKAGGFGIAFGYFGSFIAIALAFYLAGDDNNFVLSEDDLQISLGYIPSYFAILAISFFILGLPLLLVKEVRPKKAKRSLREVSRETIQTLKVSAREIRQYDDTRNFMIGWLLFVDIANTIIAFMSIIITVGLGLDADVVFLVLGIGIASAVIFTFPVGYLGDKIGPKKNFYFVGALWLIALIIAVLTNLTIFNITTPEYLAIFVGVIVGPALGGTWVCQRQMIIELAPIDRTSNYFGFANVFGRISSALGPFVWFGSIWILSNLIGLNTSISTRVTIIVLSAILLIGLYFISKVRDVHKFYLSGARHVGNGVWKNSNGEVIDLD
ncbi:MAG: MFS transporter, partial [Candidatus Heimdallarchaeota archaeon]